MLRNINYKLKMDRNSLLPFHFMHQRWRDEKRRRALHRKRRRMYLLVQQMNQNLRVLQMLLTRTTLRLLAMVRLVNPRLEYARSLSLGGAWLGVEAILILLNTLKIVRLYQQYFRQCFEIGAVFAVQEYLVLLKQEGFYWLSFKILLRFAF